MKVTAIRSFPVWVGDRNQLIVKVETNEGIHGWGESGLSSRELAVVGAIDHYREFLIGWLLLRFIYRGDHCCLCRPIGI